MRPRGFPNHGKYASAINAVSVLLPTFGRPSLQVPRTSQAVSKGATRHCIPSRPALPGLLKGTAIHQGRLWMMPR